MISAFYQKKLSALKVDRSSGHPKPHKVCLLFAVMDLISKGLDNNNKFIIDDNLKAAFSTHFQHLKKANDSEQIIQPFYHLHTDGIWHFKIKPDSKKAFDDLKAQSRSPSIKGLFDVIDYAYLDSELYDYFKSDLNKDLIKEILLENLEDLSVQFHRWLLSMGKSGKTAKNYVNAIKGSLSTWASDANICEQNLIAIQSYTTIQGVAEELKEYPEFIQKNIIGKSMYSCALNSYKDFLAMTCQAEVTNDIDEIINNTNLNPTQKAMLVNTRVGQGKFRESLIKYWKGCAITGYESTQFLVASHIKPWCKSDNVERLDKYNGILLLPNLDKAFDLGYITFADNGKIKTSEFIESPKTLGLTNDMKINIVKQHQVYLAYHRECVFEKSR